MAVARVAPERLDAGALGFRLAPRINAAGRLYRADGAVELFLTDDEDRAALIAAELDRSNQERRQTEAEVLADAERALAGLGPSGEEAPAIVLWGEGWHPGVVGICASRMAERLLRPAVLIALDGPRGKGSGRSVPGFDLLGRPARLRGRPRPLRRAPRRGRPRDRGGRGSRTSASCSGPTRRTARPSASGSARRRSTRWSAARPSATRSPQQLDAARPVRQGQSGGPAARARREHRGRAADGGGRAARALQPREWPRAGLRASRSASDGSLAGIAENGPLDVSLRLELNEWNGAVAPRVVLGSLYRAPAGEAPEPRCSATDESRRPRSPRRSS